MGDTTMVDADQVQPNVDPIKASYDVYIKPGISGERQVYVLQFPNRAAKQHYSQENDSKPFNLRIKPESGMVEIDVPMDVWRNYDREKRRQVGGRSKEEQHGEERRQSRHAWRVRNWECTTDWQRPWEGGR